MTTTGNPWFPSALLLLFICLMAPFSHASMTQIHDCSCTAPVAPDRSHVCPCTPRPAALRRAPSTEMSSSVVSAHHNASSLTQMLATECRLRLFKPSVTQQRGKAPMKSIAQGRRGPGNKPLQPGSHAGSGISSQRPGQRDRMVQKSRNKGARSPRAPGQP